MRWGISILAKYDLNTKCMFKDFCVDPHPPFLCQFADIKEREFYPSLMKKELHGYM
jgi:hypothetical protein